MLVLTFGTQINQEICITYKVALCLIAMVYTHMHPGALCSHLIPYKVIVRLSVLISGSSPLHSLSFAYAEPVQESNHVHTLLHQPPTKHTHTLFTQTQTCKATSHDWAGPVGVVGRSAH